jgi:hypothetical protein
MSNLLTVTEKIWNDPVWSKVIATVIFAVVAGISTRFPTVREFLVASSVVPHWILLCAALLLLLVASSVVPPWILLCATLLLLLGIILVVARRSKPQTTAVDSAVKITLINVDARDARGAETKKPFPLKVYCEMVNDSNRPVDVQIWNYISKELKVSYITRGALQLKFLTGVPFVPNPSVERVAVFSGQTFSAWIAPDEKLFNKESFERSPRGTGQMGTLVLKVDGREYRVPL